MDREQEDLLVLLEDLSIKRKTDKRRMRIALMDVSEDEDGDDEEEEAEEEVDGGEAEAAQREEENTATNHYPHQYHYHPQDVGPDPADEQHYEVNGEEEQGGEEPRRDEYVYGEESAVFRGGEYDAEPFEANAETGGATGWTPEGYEYTPQQHQNSLT
jgi:hypothetical protein